MILIGLMLFEISWRGDSPDGGGGEISVSGFFVHRVAGSPLGLRPLSEQSLITLLQHLQTRPTQRN
jgi:hypothetical protein